MIIIGRQEWNARPPSGPIPSVALSDRRQFIVHYSSVSKFQSVRSIQDYHMDTKGWPDIGYNFLCDYKGNLYMGRGWMLKGTHTKNFNTSGIAVCFIGTNNDVTMEAKNVIRWLADEANRLTGRTLERGGHRDYDQTTCPGDHLYEWVHNGMPIAPIPVPIEEDIMPYLGIRDPASGKVYLCFASGTTRWAGPGEFYALRNSGIIVVDAKSADEVTRLESARIDN